jgi:hypothetical protein
MLKVNKLIYSIQCTLEKIIPKRMYDLLALKRAVNRACYLWITNV